MVRVNEDEPARAARSSRATRAGGLGTVTGLPRVGGRVVEYAGISGWREVGYFAPLGGGPLVTRDAIQNCADREGASLMARIMTPLMGFEGGVTCPPVWRRFQKVSGPKVREALAELTGLSFQNLVTGHGPAVIGGADAIVRAAIDRVASAA